MSHACLINIFLCGSEQFLGDNLIRLAVAENRQDLVHRMCLKEGLDLPFYPHRFLGVCGADYDEVFGLFESVGDRLGQVARDRELVLIPEDTCDLLVLELFLKLVRHMEMLELLLYVFGDLRVEICMSVRNESIVKIYHGATLSCRYSSLNINIK